NFAIKAHLPVEGLIRATVFDHFCGGVSELDCMKTVDAIHTAGVSSVLDYSVEGNENDEEFDAVVARTLKILDLVKEKQAIPFAVFKPTAVGRFDLYVKIGEGKTLDKEEQQEWDRVCLRYETICNKAYELDVALLIDAEESWMQDAADEIVEQMMKKYNRNNEIGRAHV